MSELRDFLQKAREAYESGDFALCRRYLDQAAALDAESLGLLRWRARLAHREGQWQEVHDAAAQYCEIDPDDREMRQFLARACSNLKRWPEAVRAWQQLAELRPDWPEARFQLARAQFKSNFNAAGARTMVELEALGDHDATAWQLGGRLAVETGDVARAIALFSKLVGHDRAKAEAELLVYEKTWDQRGLLAVAAALGSADKTADAVAELTKSAALHQRDGNLVEAYGDFAAIAAAAEGDALADASMSRILLTLMNQAKRQVAQEEPRKAIQTYRTILRCQPGNERALAGIGRLMMALQDWSAAADAWEAMLDLVPRDREALTQYARAIERAQDFARARDAWAAVLAEAPQDREASEAIAKLSARIVKAGRKAVEEQRYVDAARLFALVPEDSAEQADARRRLEQVARYLTREMRAAYKERRFAHVVSLGAVAAEIAPDNADILRLLAQSAMAGRNYAIAAPAWTRLVALSQDSFAAHALPLARCHLRMGRNEDGRAVLEKLLTQEPDNQDAKDLMRQFDDAPR